MTSIPTQIAVVFDCDDTLSEDTTSWLIGKCGGDAKEIFEEAGKLVRDGWDPPLAYMSIMMNQSRDGGKLDVMKKEKILELAKSATGLFYPGTEDLFVRLRC